jgi:SAM-dependent methyltransferase
VPERLRPAGDFDYEALGAGYSGFRRPDPRIAAYAHRALGDAETVLNVGAGAGSYEPQDRHVVAVEPSASMRSQRPRHLVPALDATAEPLPFDDDAFGAAMATIIVHQWAGVDARLREMRRGRCRHGGTIYDLAGAWPQDGRGSYSGPGARRRRERVG